MQISVLQPAELGLAEIAAWHGMQRGSLANPFLSPEFSMAVGRVRPQARVAVMTEGATTVGFFPFERRSLGLGVPIGAGLTDCQGLVHAPGVEWDARELLRACRLSVWQFDHLTDGQAPFQRYQSAIARSPVIDLASGFDSYYQKLRVSSPGLCSVVGRKTRKLGREAGEVRFDFDSLDKSPLQLLMRWKSAQYQRTGRLDRFAQSWVVELLESLAATAGGYFSGVLSVLYAGDSPVAIHFGIRAGDVLAYWFPAYDLRYSKYSPGLISLLRLAEEGSGHGVRLIDLGKGSMRYKEEVKSADSFVREGIVPSRSPLALAHRARVLSVQRTMRTIRGNPHLFRAADWVLKRYGSRPSRARSGLPRPPSAVLLRANGPVMLPNVPVRPPAPAAKCLTRASVSPSGVGI